MEQANSEVTVKVDSSTNDAGQQEDEKRDAHVGDRFSGRGRGGRGVSIAFGFFT